jgi:diguanylate cyclase (GGDEF)-like protein
MAADGTPAASTSAHTAVARLLSDLAENPSGEAFVCRCLDELVERHHLVWAIAVVEDSAGRRAFTSTHTPPDAGFDLSRFHVRGGLYTEPTLVDAADDIDETFQLCRVAVQLDRLRHESQHDPLTGIHNRRGFDLALQRALGRAARYGWPFTLAVVDVDGLKAINDGHGHHRGDDVLRAVGSHLRQSLRLGDVPARIGGDEFAIVLHGNGPDSVDAILRRLSSPCEVPGLGQLAWSVGAAHWPVDGPSAESLFRTADQRLYEEKRLRRKTA